MERPAEKDSKGLRTLKEVAMIEPIWIWTTVAVVMLATILFEIFFDED